MLIRAQFCSDRDRGPGQILIYFLEDVFHFSLLILLQIFTVFSSRFHSVSQIYKYDIGRYAISVT